MDFVSDQLANGRQLRVLNVVDDFTRECVLQVVDFSISGERVARAFDQLAQSRGHCLQRWSATTVRSSPAKQCFSERATVRALVLHKSHFVNSVPRGILC